MDESMEGYPVVVEIPVRFRDLDAMGHVNNSVYLTYFEEARVKCLEAVHYDINDPEGFGFVLAEALCRYHSPLYFGEKARIGLKVSEIGTRGWGVHLLSPPGIGLKVSEIGTKSFRFVYRVEEAKTHRLVAAGYTVQVAYDYENHRSIPLSDRLIESLKGILSEA